jgi:hypothetical protein
MVVGYRTFRGLGAGRDFHGIVLAGRACPGVNTGAGERGEELFARAEPVTHDSWIHNSENLRGWRGAGNAVIQALTSIRQTIADLTSPSAPPAGYAAPILAGMFPLGDQGNSPSQRQLQIETVEPPAPIPATGNVLRYRFRIRVTVPDQSSVPRASRFRIVCRYAYRTEGARRRILRTRPNVRFTELTFAGRSQDIAGTPAERAEYTDSVRPDQYVFDLVGETDALDQALAGAARHELEIMAFLGDGEENEDGVDASGSGAQGSVAVRGVGTRDPGRNGRRRARRER